MKPHYLFGKIYETGSSHRLPECESYLISFLLLHTVAQSVNITEFSAFDIGSVSLLFIALSFRRREVFAANKTKTPAEAGGVASSLG